MTFAAVFVMALTGITGVIVHLQYRRIERRLVVLQERA
jgi:hypothetical protein